MKQEVGSVQLVSHSPLKVQSGIYGETFIFAGCWIMNEDTGSLGGYEVSFINVAY